MLSPAAHFETSQWIAANLVRVFRFFADPRNLPAISPHSSGARLVGLQLVPPPAIAASERMAGAGSILEVSVRLLPWLPLRVRWTAEILDFEYLNFFRDRQTRGPFARWLHTHSFEEQLRDGVRGTLVRDQVEYEVGFGPLGQMADAAVVRFVLRSMFEQRHRAAEKILALNQ